jgi:hypothetical protein
MSKQPSFCISFLDQSTLSLETPFGPMTSSVPTIEGDSPAIRAIYSNVLHDKARNAKIADEFRYLSDDINSAITTLLVDIKKYPVSDDVREMLLSLKFDAAKSFREMDYMQGIKARLAAIQDQTHYFQRLCEKHIEHVPAVAEKKVGFFPSMSVMDKKNLAVALHKMLGHLIDGEIKLMELKSHDFKDVENISELKPCVVAIKGLMLTALRIESYHSEALDAKTHKLVPYESIAPYFEPNDKHFLQQKLLTLVTDNAFHTAQSKIEIRELFLKIISQTDPEMSEEDKKKIEQHFNCTFVISILNNCKTKNSSEKKDCVLNAINNFVNSDWRSRERLTAAM